MRDDSIEQYLHRLEADLLDFKKAQLTGSDAVRTYNMQQTNDQWDIDWVSTIIGGFPNTSVTVTFKANTQDAPFANLRAVAVYDGHPYDPKTVYGFGRNSILIEQAFVGNSMDELKTMDIYKWNVNINTAVAGTHVQVKFYVDATDRGAITVVGPRGT